MYTWLRNTFSIGRKSVLQIQVVILAQTQVLIQILKD